MDTDEWARSQIAALAQRVAALEVAVGIAPAAQTEQPWETEIRQLLAAGKTIEAIKLYRANTGVGLEEAKARVEAML